MANKESNIAGGVAGLDSLAQIAYAQLKHINEGQVKINASTGSVKPSYTWSGGGTPAGTEQQVTYTVPLELSSLTEWPQNVSSPTDANIYDDTNTTFIENSIVNQANIWRINLNYSGKPTNVASAITVILENPLSGFQAITSIALPRNESTGSISVLLITVGDSSSLPSPEGSGQGYDLKLNVTDNMTIEVESVTRFNYPKNPR